MANALLGLGLIMASRSTSVLEFQIWYGAVIGIAGGSFFPPLIATTVGWFEKHRSLAGLFGLGRHRRRTDDGGAVLLRWLISTYEWREAQLIIGVAVLVLLTPMSLLIRRPPAVPVDVADTPQPMGAAPQPEPSNLTVGRALRTPQFIVLALVFFACCACHSGPIFHTVSFAQLCGIAPAFAVTIYSVEGVGGLFGRVVLGLAGDKFGVKPTLIVGLLIQAVGAGAYLYAANLEFFYAVAFIFGFAYGGVMPLYAVLARDYFGPNIMGAVFGAAAMISSLGMALGPAIGGWIYDTWNAYTGLYVASFVVGLGAVAIALAFPAAAAGGDRLNGTRRRALAHAVVELSVLPDRLRAGSRLLHPVRSWEGHRDGPARRQRHAGRHRGDAREDHAFLLRGTRASASLPRTTTTPSRCGARPISS